MDGPMLEGGVLPPVLVYFAGLEEFFPVTNAWYHEFPLSVSITQREDVFPILALAMHRRLSRLRARSIEDVAGKRNFANWML